MDLNGDDDRSSISKQKVKNIQLYVHIGLEFI